MSTIKSPELVTPSLFYTCPEPQSELALADVPFLHEQPDPDKVLEMLAACKVANLLEPYKEYFPLPLPAEGQITFMAHIYDRPPAEIVSVLIDVANPQNIFMPLDDTTQLHVGSGTHKLAPDSPIRFRFGVDGFDWQLTPDEWEQSMHTAAEWRHRARMAKNIMRYFCEGASRYMQEQDATHLFKAAKDLEPFKTYASQCTYMAKFVQRWDDYRRQQHRQTEAFIEIMREPDDDETFLAWFELNEDTYPSDVPAVVDNVAQFKVQQNDLCMAARRSTTAATMSLESQKSLAVESAEWQWRINVVAGAMIKNVQDDMLKLKTT